ncbi:MAG TPA: hypothetical protein ENK06_01985, partial [Gammaproteobacteria bacterium]|nr:hypothetical protein [Gammaproteobacteria bacterium]
MSLRHRIWVSSTRTILRFRLSVFVMLCLALGGTSQNIVAPKQILYLLSLGLIGWALSTKKTNYDIRFRQFPLMVAIAFVGLFGLYVLPLPPAIWTHLPGRENIVQGFELANMPLPWLPVSLTPEITLFSLLDFLPPFAIILTLLRSASKQEIKTAFYALLLMAVASVFLGLLQLIAPASGLYLYKIVNVGYPVGFFSNANHQASFLLMVLPFALRLSFANTQDIEIGMMTTTQVRALGIMLTILFLTGISLTGSLAGYLLALPVTLASVIVVGRISKKHLPYFGGLIILILTIVIVDTVFLGGQAGQLMEKVTQDSAISRTSIFATTREAIRDYPLIGTGPG